MPAYEYGTIYQFTLKIYSVQENSKTVERETDEYVLRVFMPKAAKPIRYAGFDIRTKKVRLCNVLAAKVMTKQEADEVLAAMPNAANVTYTVMHYEEAKEREAKRANRLKEQGNGI